MYFTLLLNISREYWTSQDHGCCDAPVSTFSYFFVEAKFTPRVSDFPTVTVYLHYLVYILGSGHSTYVYVAYAKQI